MIRPEWVRPGDFFVRLDLPGYEIEHVSMLSVPRDSFEVGQSLAGTGPVRVIATAPASFARMYVRTIAGRSFPLSVHHYRTAHGALVIGVGLTDPGDPPATVHAVDASGAEVVRHMEDIRSGPCYPGLATRLFDRLRGRRPGRFYAKRGS